MLEELEVLNGAMTPSFDKYNNIYTVEVGKSVNKLIIDYKVEDDSVVNIIGDSNLVPGENTVYIEVINENSKNTYTILVNKEQEQKVILSDTSFDVVEIKKELPSYVGPLIGMICFLIILIFYSILFHKKKRKHR